MTPRHNAPAQPAWRRVASVASLAAAAVLPLSGCTSTSDALSVTDPDIINPSDVESPAGANAVRLGAIARLNAATSGGSSVSEGLFLLSGLFSDEWENGDSFIARQEVDQRVITPQNNFLTDVSRLLHRARLSAEQATRLLRQYNPTGPAAELAEMYFVEAYVENAVGEHYCNGLVFSTVTDEGEQFGTPTTTTAAFERALAHADSGLALITGTSALDVRARSALRVLRGRILLNLNRPADAATAVNGVATNFRYEMLHSATTNSNAIWSYNNLNRRYSVGNSEGANGINFATAADPRLPTCQGGDATCRTAGVTQTRRDDGGPLRFDVQLLWPARETPVAIATGIEARLIEAEALLRAGSHPAFINALNALRTTVTGLAPLADPGTAAGREDLLFRERAFWLFSTGHRLGDLRRLIRQYGRTETQVFPTGDFAEGGQYGHDVNFPVPQAEKNNPQFTGCLNREA